MSEVIKVLIVDDFEMTRVMLTNALAELKIGNVIQCVDGNQAWQQLDSAHSDKKPFSVAFFDWNMPGLNGFDLLQKCRADARFKELPIIMVTAEAELQYVMKALKAGATDYITKPFSPEILSEKIKLIREKVKSGPKT